MACNVGPFSGLLELYIYPDSWVEILTVVMGNLPKEHKFLARIV
jgi:hypothetical protein